MTEGEKFCQSYLSGMSVAAISKKYKVSRYVVRKCLRVVGVAMRSSRESKLGSSNPMWKEEKVKNQGLHRWVRDRLRKPATCQECKKVPPYDLANISYTYNPDTYTRDLSNWRWLCRRCHMLTDGRMSNLSVGAPPSKLVCIVCGGKHVGWNLCSKHHQQYKNHGCIMSL